VIGLELLGSIAIFWYIKQNFFSIEDSIHGENTICRNDCMIINEDIYSAWKQVRKQLHLPGNVTATYFPHGNIKYNTKLNEFIVSVDSRIYADAGIQEQLRIHYGLQETTRFELAD
jgi:hypothetical protein